MRFIDAMNLFARDERLATDVSSSAGRQYENGAAAVTGNGRLEWSPAFPRHERLIDSAPV